MKSTIASINKPSWQYIISVKEGLIGHVNDFEYQSELFDSFEKYLTSYVLFNPYTRWNHVIQVNMERLIYMNENGHFSYTRCSRGQNYYNDAIVDLGITEDEFDIILDKLVELDKL